MPGPLSIPANLADVARRDPFPDLRNWVADLPGIVRDLTALWGLRLGDPFDREGRARCSICSTARIGWARDPVGLARRLADLLDLDADRLSQWLFARCVQESIDQPALCHVATLLAPECT